MGKLRLGKVKWRLGVAELRLTLFTSRLYSTGLPVTWKTTFRGRAAGPVRGQTVIVHELFQGADSNEHDALSLSGSGPSLGWERLSQPTRPWCTSQP